MFHQGFSMIYIQIPEKQDAKGFLLLAKSGFAVVCLPKNTYGVREEHLKLLKRKRITFKKLEASKIRMPKPALAI
jgi:hypothetical protein